MADVTYNLMLLAAYPAPTSVLIGVWPGDVDPHTAMATPSFQLTVPVDLTQDDPTIIAAIQAAVESYLVARDAEAAAAARVAAYQGVVLTHTHTTT